MNNNFENEVKSEAPKKDWNAFPINWKLNIVDDVNAPQLYSRQVINTFSILFSVLFGGVLLAINLKNSNNKEGILPVLIFSLVYTIVMIIGLSMISVNIAILPLALNALGAIGLYNYFWGKYIGKDFQYRTKPFWIPLIIGIIMTSVFVWAIIAEL